MAAHIKYLVKNSVNLLVIFLVSVCMVLVYRLQTLDGGPWTIVSLGQAPEDSQTFAERRRNLEARGSTFIESNLQGCVIIFSLSWEVA